MAQNVRRPVTVSEPYDPKQRAVGGVVLVLIMLLIYSFLQALTSLSVPSGTVQNTENGGIIYILDKEQPDEVIENDADFRDANGEFYAPMPKTLSQFVFLNIDGSPFGTSNDSNTSENLATDTPIIGPYWIVQAASFKQYSRAESLVAELKTKGIDMEIKKIGSWYTVRTLPQKTEPEAKTMRTQLRNNGIKGLVKKVE